MKSLKSHVKFNKQERSGIFFLLLLLILVQLGYFIFRGYVAVGSRLMVPDVDTQQKIDLLRQNALQKDTFQIYRFNPNFITDYRGYTLGLSIEEINRLHAFRDNNKFVNSTEEFQKVTEVSDSLLAALSPYFKFPDWVSSNPKPYVKEGFTNPF